MGQLEMVKGSPHTGEIRRKEDRERDKRRGTRRGTGRGTSLNKTRDLASEGIRRRVKGMIWIPLKGADNKPIETLFSSFSHKSSDLQEPRLISVSDLADQNLISRFIVQ